MAMTSEVPNRLLRGVSKEDRLLVESSFAEAEHFRKAAVKYLQLKWEGAHLEPYDYGNAAWPYLQASCNGKMEIIEDLLRNVFNIGVKTHARGQRKEEKSSKEKSRSSKEEGSSC